MLLRAIGFWTGSGEWLPDPSVILRRLGRQEPDHVLTAYLRGGHVLETFRGYSWCRLECGVAFELMGNADLTDGTWVWPEGLVHYVEEHGVALPDEFVRLAQYHRGVVPPLTPPMQQMTHDVRMERLAEFLQRDAAGSDTTWPSDWASHITLQNVTIARTFWKLWFEGVSGGVG